MGGVALVAYQGFLVRRTCVCVRVGGAVSVSGVQCSSVVNFGVSVGMAWLWTACLFMFRVVFLFC